MSGSCSAMRALRRTPRCSITSARWRSSSSRACRATSTWACSTDSGVRGSWAASPRKRRSFATALSSCSSRWLNEVTSGRSPTGNASTGSGVRSKSARRSSARSILGQGPQRTVQRMQQQQRHQHQHRGHHGQRGQRLAIHLAVDRALQVGDLHRDQAVAVRDLVHAPGLAPGLHGGEAVAEGRLERRRRRGRRADHQPAVIAPDLDREVPGIALHLGRQLEAWAERAVVDFLGRQRQQQARAVGRGPGLPGARVRGWRRPAWRRLRPAGCS